MFAVGQSQLLYNDTVRPEYTNTPLNVTLCRSTVPLPGPSTRHPLDGRTMVMSCSALDRASSSQTTVLGCRCREKRLLLCLDTSSKCNHMLLSLVTSPSPSSPGRSDMVDGQDRKLSLVVMSLSADCCSSWLVATHTVIVGRSGWASEHSLGSMHAAGSPGQPAIDANGLRDCGSCRSLL